MDLPHRLVASMTIAPTAILCGSPLDESKLPLAVLILGPTGSGKTALSLALGEQFAGEIVSCDSVAVYRGMDLGTAKPIPEERARLPHHLIDVANPARQAGLRTRLERSCQRHGDPWLHRVLTRLDPASAARIHANDASKLLRAIEVCLAARKPLSQLLDDKQIARDPLTGFRLLRIGLNPPRKALPPRKGLYDRLNQRAAAMFSAGLLEETRALLARYGPVKALDSLGYRQAAAFLAGTMPLEAAIEAAQQGHRNYAKRQLTWFRREPEVHWFESFGDETEVLNAAKGRVQAMLDDEKQQDGCFDPVRCGG